MFITVSFLDKKFNKFLVAYFIDSSLLKSIKLVDTDSVLAWLQDTQLCKTLLQELEKLKIYSKHINNKQSKKYERNIQDSKTGDIRFN